MIGRRLFILTLVALVGGGLALAQGVAGTAEDAIGGGADEAALAEQLKQFMTKARQERLSLERKQVAAEIEQGLLFDPTKVESAVKALDAGAKNTFADNVQRICTAFAAVDRRFGRAWGLLTGGDYKAAAEAIKPMVSTHDTTYFAAAKRYCYAEALAKAGRNQDAVDVYTELVRELSDRFSLSSLSLLHAGRTYERMHRRFYAKSLYEAWVDSYGLLDPTTSEKLIATINAIAADYNDPLAALAGKMSDVAKRLGGVDSGRDTQKRQKEIVAFLDDLIATAEEASSSSSKSQQQGKQAGEPCSKCGKKGCKGECQGKGNKPGQKPGPASGIGIPSSPATVSRLVSGEVLDPAGLSDVRPSDETDDWGRLPPRERAKLLETFKESMPERYREMIREYYKRLASQERP